MPTDESPRPIRVIAHQWIPMPDGCRLAARIWLPEGAENDPVPAILEYIPYRKNDATALRDGPIHGYFAEHGYASLRVDLRGSGDSDGILEDEYLPLEQDDALAVLSWIAEQPWCTGKVGIIGKSWGGFNGLQIAARRPPELGAVISLCSTDDRYSDDVHYMGGTLLACDMLTWASTMLAYSARPPDPAVVGDSWRAQWLDRLERTPPYVEAWMAHQRRDEFWKQGSVCEDYAGMRAPIYMVGGWADAYRDAILRMVEHYPGPVKGLIGPWAHIYPHDGTPGPAIGFLQECLRWWDHWLKGVDTGIMDEPRLRAWMQDAVRPASSYAERPGRWMVDPSWPSPHVESRPYHLTADRSLAGEPAGEPVDLAVTGVQASPTDPGVWCAYGGPVDMPTDQRLDDGVSLAFDGPELTEPVEIYGNPVARLTVRADRPQALVAVRLCDVWPDGTSTLITRGLLNLSHRDGHEHPEPLEPGEAYEVRVPLTSTAYAVPVGHRLRVAVSPTYWPWAWPSPTPVTLQVATGGASVLDLPVRVSAGDDAVPFAAPEAASKPRHEPRGAGAETRQIRRDTASGAVELVHSHGPFGGFRLLDEGLDYRDQATDTFRIVEGDPLSASVRCDRTVEIAREGWRARVETTSTMSATATEFLLTNAVEAFENDVRIHTVHRTTTVPRDHV